MIFRDIKLFANSLTHSSVAVLCFALLLQGCGATSVVDVGEFAPYVESFQQRAADQGVPVRIESLRIEEGQLAQGRVAACSFSGRQGVPTITVDRHEWSQQTETGRRATIFHELGHCVLKRRHLDELRDDGIPSSLMNSYSMEPDVYEVNEQYYLQELFAFRQL